MCFPDGYENVNAESWARTSVTANTNEWLNQWSLLSSGKLVPEGAIVVSHADIREKLNFLPAATLPDSPLSIDCSGSGEACDGTGGVEGGFGTDGAPQGYASYIGAYDGNAKNVTAPGFYAKGGRREIFPFPISDTSIKPEDLVDDLINLVEGVASTTAPATTLMAALVMACLALLF